MYGFHLMEVFSKGKCIRKHKKYAQLYKKSRRNYYGENYSSF